MSIPIICMILWMGEPKKYKYWFKVVACFMVHSICRVCVCVCVCVCERERERKCKRGSYLTALPHWGDR